MGICAECEYFEFSGSKNEKSYCSKYGISVWGDDRNDDCFDEDRYRSQSESDSYW